MKNNKLKLHFLGGLGEVGKNCLALEYDEDIIIIDIGLAFPTEEMLGIDLVIPDFTYLTNNAHKIRGVMVTHGHEDHIGAIPYFLKHLNVPVYGTKLTLMLLDNKLREHALDNPQLNCIKAGNTVKAGCFSVEFINVNHSIAGACALAITTPVGVIFHSGDFKVDFTPVDGETMNLSRIAEIGKKGVLLLMADSTNAERKGFTMSERTVGASLGNIFDENKTRRIIIATFASNVHRLQQIIDLAAKHNRKVALSGRSMLNVCEAAIKIGELKCNNEIFVDIEKISKIEDKDLVIISTGSQGEPMSALTRMSSGDFNKVKIGNNDTIIISASPIPGNEKMVYRVINNLYRLGAEVIYSSLADVHVSGHACVEELKMLQSLVNPKYFIPVHGEYRHLKKHKDIAVAMGVPEHQTLLAEIGDTIEVSRTSLKKTGTVPAGSVLVDGLGFGELDSVMIRDRKHLSEDGLLVVVIAIKASSGELANSPEIIPRGVGLNQNADAILLEAKNVVLSTIATIDIKGFSGRMDLKNELRKSLRNYFAKKVKQRPMILPIILEV